MEITVLSYLTPISRVLHDHFLLHMISLAMKKFAIICNFYTEAYYLHIPYAISLFSSFYFISSLVQIETKACHILYLDFSKEKEK